MPTIFNTKLYLIVFATVFFFMLGWVWYDMLFGARWVALTGVTPELVEATMARSMAVGILLSFAQALGIAYVMDQRSHSDLIGGLLSSGMLWLLFALPITAYSWNYEGRPLELLFIDAGYLLVAYLLIGAIYGSLKKN